MDKKSSTRVINDKFWKKKTDEDPEHAADYERCRIVTDRSIQRQEQDAQQPRQPAPEQE